MILFLRVNIISLISIIFLGNEANLLSLSAKIVSLPRNVHIISLEGIVGLKLISLLILSFVLFFWCTGEEEEGYHLHCSCRRHM